MEVGDELVNINGTPLYGSRQEALILIKGSYKILKMIVRRRDVSVVRPHSWHLAKLYEVHPDVANMQYPTDAFSLSWHSGCETSESPIQWNPLSRHCSTDKSSSIGSMESLDQPGQNYYEGTLSPIDPGMYQNKRDSAYSSFSASSNTSDYTLSARTEESSPFNCNLGPTKQEDGRYLQTGQNALDSQDNQTIVEHSQSSSSFPYDANVLGSVKSPPQPPVRRDSLRAPKNQGCHAERRRASAPGETFYIPGKWSKDTNLLNSTNCSQGQYANELFTQKENLPSHQYYMLSSQPDGAKADNFKLSFNDQRQNSNCSEQTNGWSEDNGDEDVACFTVQNIRERFLKKSSCELKIPKSNCQGSGRRTVFTKNTNMTPSEMCHYNTDNRTGENGIDKKWQNRTCEVPEAAHIDDFNDCISNVHHGVSFDRPGNELGKSKDSSSQTSNFAGGQGSLCSTTLQEPVGVQEETAGLAKKTGSTRNRSAQMRRKSDRFATNLRNEIQKRKSQLQKSKGSSVLCGEDPVEEGDEPTDSLPRPGPPPPPPPKNKARLLEIKKANAEKHISDTSSRDNEKLKMFTCNQEGNMPCNSLHSFTHETDSAGEKTRMMLGNKAFEDQSEKSSSGFSHRDLLDDEEKHQGQSKPLLGHSDMDLLQATNRSPNSDSCRDEWPVSCSKSSSPNTRESNRETNAEHLKCDEQHMDFSVQNTNAEICKTSSNQNTCPTNLSETFTKNSSEDKHYIKKPISFGNESIPSSVHLNKVHHGADRSAGDQRNINNLEHISQEQNSIESKFCALNNISSARSMQPNVPHQPFYSGEVLTHHKPHGSNFTWSPDYHSPPHSHLLKEGPSAGSLQAHAFHQPFSSEEGLTHHKPHGANCTWSPDHHNQSHSHLLKEGPSDVISLNMDRLVPPITRVIEENVLMPFADRRRFFEDSSKVPASTHQSMHIKANKNNFCSNLSDYSLPHIAPLDLRRHSVDHTCYPSSPSRPDSGLSCAECLNHAMESPSCCVQSGLSSDCLHSVPYSCKPCAFCANDLCPALLKRTHHSYHCQHHHHHHHHHQWARCGEFMYPSQHSLLEEGSSIPSDPWHLRKPILQEVPLKEWNQKKINRKCSQSVSELCPFNTNFHHFGSHRSCCESNDQEWPQYNKAASTYDLSYGHSLRSVDLASVQDRSAEQGLTRGRAYSVNQLNLEGLSFRDKQDLPLAKLEETVPLSRPKKQAPPRPPPPNWEKYKQRKSSHDSTKSFSGHDCCLDGPCVHGYNSSADDARQRSNSLPTNNTFLQMQQNLPLLLQGTDYSAEASEMEGTSQGSRDQSLTESSSQEPQNDTPPVKRSACFIDKAPSDNEAESETADEGDQETHSFCSKTSNIGLPFPDNSEREYPPALVDVFEGSYRHLEDEWSTDRESEVSIPERYEFQPISPPHACGAVSPTCTSYYNTSAAKAGLLNKMKEMPGMQKETGSATGAEEEEDDLTFKKMQLIESITRKVSVLHEAQQGLQEDLNANMTLGCELESLLKNLCKPHEYDKFRSFIGDLDKVVNLLLSLSGRLSRVESALNCEDPEPSMEEKLNLSEKKKQLTNQLQDAQELKAHVTRREQLVLEAVSKYLNEDQLQDYQHYVRMTSALIVEQRELEDKIRLGEEQLRCLRESL
ncbi:protein Shroom4 [Gastrophryne carolinensis]